MGSYIEQWREKLRGTKEVEDLAVGVYRTKPETVIEIPGIEIRLLVVGDKGYGGLPKGVYAETNLALRDFVSNGVFQMLIIAHITTRLIDQAFPLANLGNSEHEVNVLSSISCSRVFSSPYGHAILQIEPTLPSDLERAYKITGPALQRPSLN